ncbi:hypothetical protein QF030_000297 [Streptomyces rishiriensis]|uniref:Uncharacterized protein n=1 Tax=Streptomyces rishiriensis TaxID=68264 RepID=A0ABU0NG98_STRRH|nr:hypothetical protein [Streptomyces rishiriensis]
MVAEILYGLQARTEAGSKTWDHFLRPLCDRLRADGAPSLEVFADPAKFETLAHTKAMRSVVRTMLVWLTRLGATPESERQKDVWDLHIFTGSRVTLPRSTTTRLLGLGRMIVLRAQRVSTTTNPYWTSASGKSPSSSASCWSHRRPTTRLPFRLSKSRTFTCPAC